MRKEIQPQGEKWQTNTYTRTDGEGNVFSVELDERTEDEGDFKLGLSVKRNDEVIADVEVGEDGFKKFEYDGEDLLPEIEEHPMENRMKNDIRQELVLLGNGGGIFNSIFSIASVIDHERNKDE